MPARGEGGCVRVPEGCLSRWAWREGQEEGGEADAVCSSSGDVAINTWSALRMGIKTMNYTLFLLFVSVPDPD